LSSSRSIPPSMLNPQNTRHYPLEKALQLWARDVLQAPGQHQAGGLLEVSLDGRHLKGSARGGVGDKAIALVLAYLSRWGLLRPGPGFPGRGPYRPGRPANRGHHFLHRKDNRAEPKDGAARRTMCAATTRYLAAHRGFGGLVPPRKPHRSLRWPCLGCNSWSRSTATRPTNAAVESARKPTSLSPAQANAASLGASGHREQAPPQKGYRPG